MNLHVPASRLRIVAGFATLGVLTVGVALAWHADLAWVVLCALLPACGLGMEMSE